jgi:hypothetical protein
MDDFHTAFPGGSWMVAFLSFPLHASSGEYLSRQESGEERTRFLEIEAYIMRQMVKAKAKRIISSTCVRNEGVTEWFFTSTNVIHRAFSDAQERYGGDLHLFDLRNLSVERERKRKIAKSRKFEGEIVTTF